MQDGSSAGVFSIKSMFLSGGFMDMDKTEQKRAYAREYARKRRAIDPMFVEKQRAVGRKSQAKRRLAGVDTTAEWKQNNKERIAAYNKEYAQENSESINKTRAKRREAKKDHIAQVTKAWKEKNKENIRAYNKQYTSERYKSDPVYKLKINQRSRTRAILKANKTAKTHELLGCSYDELKIHIELQFKDGMGWHNMGEWHIDHIIPLAAFDLTVEANQKLAFNYKNLQPLWAIENLKKGAKHG